MACYTVTRQSPSVAVPRGLFLLLLLQQFLFHYFIILLYNFSHFADFPFSCTIWAACLIRTGSVVQPSLPHMTFTALPPYLFIDAWQNLIGGKIAVQCWVPLLGNFRVPSSKIVKAGQEFFVGAIRASAVS